MPPPSADREAEGRRAQLACSRWQSWIMISPVSRLPAPAPPLHPHGSCLPPALGTSLMGLRIHTQPSPCRLTHHDPARLPLLVPLLLAAPSPHTVCSAQVGRRGCKRRQLRPAEAAPAVLRAWGEETTPLATDPSPRGSHAAPASAASRARAPGPGSPGRVAVLPECHRHSCWLWWHSGGKLWSDVHLRQ